MLENTKASKELKEAPPAVLKAREKVHNDRHGRVGLRERLLAAKDEVEVRKLLEEGAKYTMATAKTKRGWERAAACARKAFAWK